MLEALRPVATILPELNAVATILAPVILSAYKAPELTLVEARMDPAVILDTLRVPELKEVATAFVTVELVAYNAAELTLVEARMDPAVIVEALTEPALILATLANDVTLMLPVVIFVSIKLLVVTLTATTLPATYKFPDKLKFPPVIVVPEMVVPEIVLLAKLPVLNAVATMLVPVILRAYKAPELTLVEARIDPVVIVETLRVPELKVV